MCRAWCFFFVTFRCFSKKILTDCDCAEEVSLNGGTNPHFTSPSADHGFSRKKNPWVCWGFTHYFRKHPFFRLKLADTVFPKGYLLRSFHFSPLAGRCSPPVPPADIGDIPVALIKDRKTNEAWWKVQKHVLWKGWKGVNMKRFIYNMKRMKKVWTWRCEAVNLFFNCILFCLSLFISKHYCMLDNIF